LVILRIYHCGTVQQYLAALNRTVIRVTVHKVIWENSSGVHFWELFNNFSHHV
jgi:hypothetical protein